MHADSLKNTHPIEVKVDRPEEIGEIFDEISYGKGASVLRMIYTWYEAPRTRRLKLCGEHVVIFGFGFVESL